VSTTSDTTDTALQEERQTADDRHHPEDDEPGEVGARGRPELPDNEARLVYLLVDRFGLTGGSLTGLIVPANLASCRCRPGFIAPFHPLVRR
jgi:hypothetical protein